MRERFALLAESAAGQYLFLLLEGEHVLLEGVGHDEADGPDSRFLTFGSGGSHSRCFTPKFSKATSTRPHRETRGNFRILHAKSLVDAVRALNRLILHRWVPPRSKGDGDSCELGFCPVEKVHLSTMHSVKETIHVELYRHRILLNGRTRVVLLYVFAVSVLLG